MALAMETTGRETLSRRFVVKIYLAGNFPAMKDPKFERKLMIVSHMKTGEWKRLVSFYFDPDIQTIFDLKRSKTEKED